MQEIKKIKGISVAKILALFGILIGFIQGILMGQLSSQYAQEGIALTLKEALEYIMQTPTIGLTPLFVALGWWSVILAPIALGLSYFVSGLVLAWIFNMFTKLVGGVKIEIKESKKK